MGFPESLAVFPLPDLTSRPCAFVVHHQLPRKSSGFSPAPQRECDRSDLIQRNDK